ncbi:hypothetical protein OJAV_G00136240 [Oryzias javanicus]|uniref:SET domain-containing protein n=1 Tax=Oryzias javanicus TaxID=123683 RepID=A0A3S2U5T3_ORYJA|nr:hypothetical protein OJAV_G00136240 [Oryzias javanicus]
MAQDRKPDRRVIHCLLCFKPTDTLSAHLARVCMKEKTPEERAAELQRAKESCKLWIREGRTWDYNDICCWCPQTAIKPLIMQLKRKGFLLQNVPQGFEEADTEATLLQADSHKIPTSDAGQSATISAASSESDPDENPSSDEPEMDATWQRPTPQFSTPLRARMQQNNLYAKFPPENPLLLEFRHHLVNVMQISNCQQEVDNVARVLRYIQPSGDEINLDFIENTTVLGDYFDQLRRVGLSAATRINYIKSLLQFLKFLKISRGGGDHVFYHKCGHYMDFLTVLRKPISKSHSKDLCSKRHDYFVGEKTSIHTLRLVLRKAKKDILEMFRRLLNSEDLTEEEKTRYRYYCEALLLLGHCQRPGVAEGLTVTEWLQRIKVNGRTVVAVKSHKTANSQVASFALTEEEDSIIHQYYLSVRPCHLKDDSDNPSGADRLFVARNGTPVGSATNDLRRLHEYYKCPNVTSQQIRRAMETEGNARLTDEQKTGLAHYLGKVALVHYRMRDPTSIVDTANPMQVLTERSSDDSDEDPASHKRPHPAEEFGRFAEMFPVTLHGKPPNKVTRVEAGFSEDRTLYDRWRGKQFKLREAHLLGRWTRRPPTATKIKREIEKEQWHSNCPSAESILERWEPPRKEDVESSSKLMKQVETQRWKYLAVVEPSPKAGEGKGVITTKTFPMNSILCDYHGEVISGAEGRRRIAERENAMGTAFFFKCGKEDLCIDATNTPCLCHPDQETFGRLINYSKKRPNVRPAATLMNFPEGQRYVLFFRAMRDLAVNEELLFDYGVRRDSFGGEGADLTWLDE